ncbi:MAG: hypothetical protein KDC38_11120, partial [Planctomycetes bacterium]|nr:hypothetical protein [Planctomycetota bacterium]
MRSIALSVVAVLSVAVLFSGCKGADGDTIFVNNPSPNPNPTTMSRSDHVATMVEESWSDNYQSINIPETEDLEEVKVFKCVDGAGILAWRQGDDGNEHAYVAFFDTTGGVVNQVRLRGFGIGYGAYDDAISSMEVLWLPDGDALIAFIAEQASDVTDAADAESLRAYVAYFDRSMATIPWNSAGTINYGFHEAMPFDTNVVGSDDNDVDSIFMATNLMDGAQQFQPSNELDNVRITGDSGDPVSDFAFIGWTYRDAMNDRRVEGYFVDLNDADSDGNRREFTSSTPTQIPLPGLDVTEDVDTIIYTCGTDMLFMYNDSTATPANDRMFLVRIDDSTNPATIGTTTEITRGTNINAAVNIVDLYAMVGDGHRILNGQSGTWIIYAEQNYEDGTVTQTDTDLVIAHVAPNGTLEIGEFDHNPAGAVDTNALDTGSVQVQVCRGATRAYVYYMQTFDASAAAVQSDLSLFVRAVRLSDTGTLVQNVSPEGTVNSLHDTDDNGDTDVISYEIADRQPFFGVDNNNDATYVAYVQEIDGDLDGRQLRARLVTIDDIGAGSLSISLASEDVVVANSDEDWDTSLSGDYDYFVLENNTPSGRGLVYFVDNGNSAIDDSALGAFFEPRPMLYASLLPNEHAIMTPTQMGSDSSGTLLPFPHFKTLDSDSAGLEAMVTPVTAAGRDAMFDTDTSFAEMAHFIFGEYLSVDGSEEGATYRGRTLSLGDVESVGDRWIPALSQLPHNVGDVNGTEFEDQDELDLFLVSEGNDLVCIFNTGAADDDGDATGRF